MWERMWQYGFKEAFKRKKSYEPSIVGSVSDPVFDCKRYHQRKEKFGKMYCRNCVETSKTAGSFDGGTAYTGRKKNQFWTL